MIEPKPMASLGPTLLARKGAARPAMRPQVAPLTNFERKADLDDEAHDDLGWNDMGQEERHSAEVFSLTPAPANAETKAQADASDREAEAHLIQSAPEQHEVHRQQDELARRIPAKPVSRTPKRRRALDSGRRAAFTLRVDAQRHLKLRLACTIRNRSAQQIVTEALDKFLSDMPELDALAAQVKRK